MTYFCKRIVILFVLCVSVNIAFAQTSGISVDETLRYLNRKFNNICKIEIKNGDLVAEFYDNNGTVIRKDRGVIEHLDHTRSSYSADEKMIYLFCSEDDCVERKLMGNTKVTRMYDRYPFIWEGDEKSARGIINAFNHLIRSMNESKYKNTEPFE